MTQSLRRGRASDANLAASMAAECFQGLPDGYSHFDLVHLVENNGKEIGVGPAAIAHYRFLVIRWTQAREWREPGERPVVFLRVDRTAEERSLSEVRVRQFEYELNEAGLLTWTDRGDYHRSGTRDAQGRILFAHGVDLSPGAVMLPKLLEIDARRRGELKERAGLRARISRLKGYVKPLLARAIEDGLTDPDNAGWQNGTEMLKAKTNATTPLERLQEIAINLSCLGDTLNGLVSTDAHDGEDHDAGCGKARKACGRRRKTIGASIENYRPIYTTRDSKTDKSVTSTPSCGQSTAWSGEADVPCGAKSSIEMVNGRKNEGGRALGSEMESTRGGRCAGGSRRKPSGELPPVNFHADARTLTLGHVEGGPDGKGRERWEAAISDACGHGKREKNDNGSCGVSQKPEALREQRSRDGKVRGTGSKHGGAPANDPCLPTVRPTKGGLWKPDTGIGHLSPLNVVETAGPRMLAAVSRANRIAETDQPDWGGIEDAAEDLCSDLGIGSQVWWIAVTVMGRRAAAICVMLIDRKMIPDAENPVRCPGAYLRGMTDRARHDRLHLHASVFGWARRVAA